MVFSQRHRQSNTRQYGFRTSVFMMGAVIILVVLSLGVVSFAQQTPATPPDLQLKACQEQLTDTRAAVTKIHQPTAAFQAEQLVALDRKLGEALQQQERDAMTIKALRQHVEELEKLAPTPAVKP